MALFKALLGELTHKGKLYPVHASLTVVGNLEELRNFIKEKCDAPGHGGLVENGSKESWLPSYVAKTRNVKEDVCANPMFRYTLEWKTTGGKGTISCNGVTTDGTSVSLGISFVEYAYGQKDVQKALDIIKESITDKFPQK